MNIFRKSCAICESGEALCELFHRETGLTKKTGITFSSHIARAFDDICFIEANKKRQISLDVLPENTIKLKPYEYQKDLISTILNRKSSRKFTGNDISFEILSTILRFSYGKSNNNTYSVPSAGGNYPIKLIIIINKIIGLQSGIYEYSHENSSLIPIYVSSDISYNNLTQSTPLAVNAAFSIHFIGDLELVCYKYQDRGYRFMNIECGHIAQNISLLSEALNIGSICSGGFLDGEFLNELKKYAPIKTEGYVELYEMFLGAIY